MAIPFAMAGMAALDYAKRQKAAQEMKRQERAGILQSNAASLGAPTYNVRALQANQRADNMTKLDPGAMAQGYLANQLKAQQKAAQQQAQQAQAEAEHGQRSAHHEATQRHAHERRMAEYERQMKFREAQRAAQEGGGQAPLGPAPPQYMPAPMAPMRQPAEVQEPEPFQLPRYVGGF